MLRPQHDRLVQLVAAAPAAVRTARKVLARNWRARSSVSVGVRAEKLHIGAVASGREVSLEGLLRDVVYKGTVVDHVVELPDGQTLAVTSVRRELGAEVNNVTVSCSTDDLVLLEP